MLPQKAASSGSGTPLMKSGTKPNVFWISASVGFCGAALRFSAAATVASEATRESESASLFI